MNRSDVIIAGGGYAGLAAARELGSRARIIDQHDIGAIQRSACAMPVSVVERFGAQASIVQRYDTAFFHDPRGTHRYPLTSPYCIIDHWKFCRLLWEQTDAPFTKARIREFKDSVVKTSSGDFGAPLFVDATGWPGVLSAPFQSVSDRRSRLTVAIEADVPGSGEGIHFYYLGGILPKGYGWVFPSDDELRVGVASYDRDVDLRQSLRGFLEHLGLNGKPSRGGMIPWFRGEPVFGSVFAAGDAAGQCLPLTAEGIRLALGFGSAAGRILRRVVDGDLQLEAAHEEYRSICSRQRRRFTALRLSQRLIGFVPDIAIHLIAHGIATERAMSPFLKAYLSLGADASRAA